jgi:hypothetical protein
VLRIGGIDAPVRFLIQKLANIRIQRHRCFKAAPAKAGQIAAALFNSRKRTTRLPCFKLVQCVVDRIKIIIRLPQQGNDVEATKLLAIIHAVVAAMFADGMQQALLLPEAQCRHAHSHTPCCCANPQAIGNASMRLGCQVGRQGTQCGQRVVKLMTCCRQIGVAFVDQRQCVGKPIFMHRLHDLLRALCAKSTDQLSGSFERRQVLPRVAAISGWAALDWREKPSRLVIAHLLHADLDRIGKVFCPQIAVNYHVKLSHPCCDFLWSIHEAMPVTMC